MHSKMLEEIGRKLKIDKQGRVTLGPEYKDKQDWFLYYDLAVENVFVICSESAEGDALVKAHSRPLTLDEKGRCYVPAAFRSKIDGSIFLKRFQHGLIVLSQTDNVWQKWSTPLSSRVFPFIAYNYNLFYLFYLFS